MSHQDRHDPKQRPDSGAPPGTGRPTRNTATRGPARRGPYVVAGVLLSLAILLPLMPQTYSFNAPTLGGIPFFYWYQLLWVPISAALSGVAYWLVTTEDRRRRAAARAGATGLDGDAANGDERP
ncbi:DUF3311 domain-containing protein [Arthrobacter globiformis]|uniref:DUF3311 domain-containing protein n=1 Tax=Arthrobacter globiformis TaxID=1665 RepID=UPI0027888627|nr:DUF3311 domain-containing protein [Arthrobacter globiformis]MDQ0865368.1 hypothetical protein [Arthrobacter globiformis]